MALIAMVACNDADVPDLTWCGPAGNGVEAVANTGSGLWEHDGVEPRLVELWRAGGLNEGQDLAVPAGFALASDGRVAIPDFQLGEVVVVEADGTWNGPWTRQGDGPGEIRVPVTAGWGDDGTLAVFDVAGSKVVFLRDGEPVGEDLSIDPSFTGPVVASGSLAWAGVRGDGTTYLQPGPQPDTESASGWGDAVIHFERGATEPDTLLRVPTPMLTAERFRNFAAPGWPRPVAALGPEGRVAVAREDGRYGLRVHGPDGREMEVCRDAEPVPLSPAERGDDDPGDAADPELLAALREAPRPEMPTAFGRIFFGTDGRLWVQRERPDPLDGTTAMYGRPGARYDVFEADGDYLGEVRAPNGARLQGASGDTVWAFEVGDLDEIWVVAYRLEVE